MRTLELKIPPPIVAVLVGAAMWVTADILPSTPLAGQWRLLIAGVCSGFGVLVALLGFLALRQANTTINPVNPEKASSVVTRGIYSYTRNPMYLGLTALLAGWAVWLSVGWVFLGPLAFMLYL